MSLRAALLTAFSYALVIVLVILLVPLVLNVSRRVDAEIKAESANQAQLVATTAHEQLEHEAQLSRLVRRAERGVGGRVVIVDSDGRILADSAGPGLTGTDYSNRPEIASALDGTLVQGRRESQSLGEELLVTAVPMLDGGRSVGAVRITQSVAAVDDEVREDVLVLIGAGFVALLFGLGVAWFLAGSLTGPLTALAVTARRVAAGDLRARAPTRGSREQREVAIAFNEMTERLESVLEAQRQFVANASHQLRTPLTAIRLRLEAAEEQATDAAVADLRAADAELDRLTHLLENLLVLAREGQEPPGPVPVRLDEAAADAFDRWAADAEDRGLSLALTGKGETTVAASRADVGIILDNLIENALKYSPEGGRIEIGWHPAPPVAPGRIGVLSVSDEGPGLGPGESEQVLERFYRGQAGAAQPGTGLGLAIVAALTHRWSGRVELENRSGRGLRAAVELPLADGARTLAGD